MSSSREEEILHNPSGEEMQIWLWMNPERYEMASVDRLLDLEADPDE